MPSRARVLAAREDVAVFADLVERPLTAVQAGALGFGHRTTVIRAGRQSGKSRTLAVGALWWAMRKSEQRVLIISAGESGALRLLAEVRSIAAASELLRGAVVDESASLLRLANGSEVRSVPASERQIRGWTVDLLLIDEAAQVADSLIYGAALPSVVARPEARVVLASSPLSTTGAFFTYAQQAVAGDPHVVEHRWRLEDAPWLTAEALAALRAGMPPELARAEIDGEWIDLSAGFSLVPNEWIVAAVGRDLPGTLSGLVAVDVARFGGDRTVAYSNLGGRVRRRFEASGMDTQATADRLRLELQEMHLAVRGVDVLAVIDDAGVGGGVTDRARALGLPVLAFLGAERAERPERFANRRAEVAWCMREAFEAGEVDLDPEDRTLIGQVRGLRYGHDERGRVLLESKADMRARGLKSPDHADAVCMAFARRQWRPEHSDYVEEPWPQVYVAGYGLVPAPSRLLPSGGARRPPADPLSLDPTNLLEVPL